MLTIPPYNWRNTAGANPGAAYITLKVQMRTCRHSRTAYETNGLALHHRLPVTGAHLVQVGVKGHVDVADNDIVPVAARVVRCGCDHAFRGSSTAAPYPAPMSIPVWVL